MIKRIVRDNTIVNPLVRSALRFISRRMNLRQLTDRYQVYGNVRLDIEGQSFLVYSKGDDLIASELFYRSDYETSEFKLVKALARNASLFVDVGANTGLFSLFAAKANPNLKVISFEPHPSNFVRLKKNISINGMNNIEAVEIALGDNESVIKFTVPSDESISATSSANHGFSKNFHAVDHKEISVKQTTLANALTTTKVSSGDLLKIDVEYYELNVIRGAADILRQSRPFVMIEALMYDRLIGQFPQMKGVIDPNHSTHIQEFLETLGYHPYALHNDGVSAIRSVNDPHPTRNFLFVYGPPSQGLVAFDKIVAA